MTGVENYLTFSVELTVIVVIENTDFLLPVEKIYLVELSTLDN